MSDGTTAAAPDSGARKSTAASGAEYVLRQVRESGVQLVSLWFTDLVGRLKSVAITDEQLESALDEGVAFDGGTLGGMVRDLETDLLLVPDPGTFVTLPYRDTVPPVARMFCDLQQADGARFALDPRTILKRAVERARALGFTFYVGCEVEHYYFARGEPRLQVIDRSGYFDVTPDKSTSGLRRDTVRALEELGIGVESTHHEVGPGQYEVKLQYADALTMADSVMTHRHVVRQLAEGYDVHATFMPKPLEGENGSGLHLTLMLHRGDENAFHDPTDEDGLSTTARHFVGGLLEHAPGVTLLTNQLVNSYKRLVAGYEAPVWCTWARANFADLVRVPTFRGSRGELTQVEYRSPDPACNPYLAFAAVLAAGLDGVEAERTPPPMRVASVTPQDAGPPLPASLREAADRAASSELLRELLGEQALAILLENARLEWEAYHRHVSDWELDRYYRR